MTNNINIHTKINSLKDELTLNPDNLEILIKLTQCLVDTKDYIEAEKYLKFINRLAPNNPAILSFLGNVCYEQNKFQDAVLWYSHSIKLNPFNAQTYFSLGNTNKRMNNLEDAIICLEKSLDFSVHDEEKIKAYNTLGLIYLDQNETELAIACFEKILTIEPNFEIALINLSSALIRKGDFKRAEVIIEQLPENSSFNALRIIQRSCILKAHEKIDEAIACLNDGLKQTSSHTAALYAQLAEIYKAVENNDQATKCYELALKEQNNNWPVLANLTNLAIAKQDYNAAKNYIDKLLQLNPHYATAYTMLANISMREKNLEGTINCAEIAMHMDKNEIEAYVLAAEAYLRQYFESGYDDENLEKKAIEIYLKALEISPNDPTLTSRIGYLKRLGSGELELKLIAASIQKLFNTYNQLKNKEIDLLYFTKEEAIALAIYCNICVINLWWDKLDYAKPILKKVITDQLHDNLPCCIPVFSSHYLFPSLEIQKDIAMSYSNSYKSTFRYHIYDMPSTKLRIGYISPDLNEHVVGFLLGNMFSYHSKEQFEIYGYSLRQKYDQQRKLIAQCCDKFVDLTDLSNKNAAEVIYRDKIDILIDLAGYTAGCRPEILSYQPAPIQAHFIGQAGTMGADFIQYHIGTETLIPEHHLPYYTEQIVYLPETVIAIQQHDVPDKLPTREEYNLPENDIVFCCFNNHYRINEEMFNCWLNILQAVPNSVLWLSCTTNESIICLKNYAQAHQINPERLIFKAKTILNDDWHHRLADLYLDTFPIAAGTTSMLSAWVGLPVLTLAADTPQSRYGAEIMNAAGITSTTASSKDEYYKIAVDLATSPNKLLTIKQSLLNNRFQAPLFNQKRYIMQLEKAYQLMYEDYKTGAKQKLIRVPK